MPNMVDLDALVQNALSHPDEPLLIHDQGQRPIAVLCTFDAFMAAQRGEVKAIAVKQRETRKQRKDRQRERRRIQAAQARARQRFPLVMR